MEDNNSSMGNIVITLAIGILSGYMINKSLSKMIDDKKESRARFMYDIVVMQLRHNSLMIKRKNEERVKERLSIIEEILNDDSDDELKDVFDEEDPMRTKTPCSISSSRISTPVHVDNFEDCVLKKDYAIENVKNSILRNEVDKIKELCIVLDSYIPEDRLMAFFHTNQGIDVIEYKNNFINKIKLAKLHYNSEKVLTPIKILT